MIEKPPALHLFQAYGVELEYMIVDRQTLSIRPLTDEVIHRVTGNYVSDVEFGPIAWSNEIALHVIELKTNGPAPSLRGLDASFQGHVRQINQILATMDCRLMPTAMHPWMDPHRELRLWPHEYSPVYEAYNRIFDCRGHGWANLQSTHINLPFAGDDEFGRLHAAIRLLLPLLPALAASSPIADRRRTGFQDYRMYVYQGNSAKIPSIAGEIIPENVFTQHDYDREIFQRTYRDIAPFDPEGILQQPFLNSRGAIARFERGSIEIRVLDVQESPAADLAICQIVAEVLRMLVEEQYSPLALQQSMPVKPLAQILNRTIRDGEEAWIDNPSFLEHFGLPTTDSLTARQLWAHLFDLLSSRREPLNPGTTKWLELYRSQGPLARRIERSLADDLANLSSVYSSLCDCLASGQFFQQADG